MRIYNAKIIKSKSIVECFINLDNYIAYDFKLSKATKRRKFEELDVNEQYESMRKKINYYENKKYEIKRLIDCNWDSKSSFLTLTFKKNLKNVKVANAHFTLFIKRLKYYLKLLNLQLKYIATWELQERGAIHYHVVLFNVPFINSAKLQKLWGFGFIKINKIDVSRESVGVYIAKYFSKDLEKKMSYKKAYFHSRNLKKPSYLKRILDDAIIDKIAADKNVIFSKEYENSTFEGYDEHNNKIFNTSKCMYFVLKNEKEVISHITSSEN